MKYMNFLVTLYLISATQMIAAKVHTIRAVRASKTPKTPNITKGVKAQKKKKTPKKNNISWPKF